MRKKLKYKKDQSKEETNMKIEMNRYESYSYASKDENILKWWKQHENILPLLSNIAKTVLAIPASSAKSERVFSTGGNVVTKKRNRLAPKKVEKLIITAENGKHVEDEEDIEGEVFEIEDIVDLVEITTTPEVGDSEDSDTEPESDVEDFSEEDDSEEEELVL